MRVETGSQTIGRLMTGQYVREQCTERARKILNRAQADAPVASGRYKASLHLEQDTTDRVAVRVVADVAYAVAVEADHGTLARAARAAR